MDYPESAPFARNGPDVAQALKHPAFEGLEVPVCYRGSGTFVQLRIWARVGGPEYGDNKNEWSSMLDIQWRGEIGDRRMSHELFRPDAYVCDRVRPVQVGDCRQASNYRLQLLAVMPDQRVAAISWDDQNRMTTLCDLLGRAAVAQLGTPRQEG